MNHIVKHFIFGAALAVTVLHVAGFWRRPKARRAVLTLVHSREPSSKYLH